MNVPDLPPQLETPSGSDQRLLFKGMFVFVILIVIGLAIAALLSLVLNGYNVQLQFRS